MREVNPRGHGTHLRDEILLAAARLLRTSSRDAITLRAIARDAGIAAPSIYPHFADRDAVLDTLITGAFEMLSGACAQAAAASPPGAARVRAVCAAYVAFARERPDEYRTIFDRLPGNLTGPAPFPPGLDAFRALVDAIASAVADGSSASTDPELDAQALWPALHGVLVIRPATPGFPWRDQDEIVERLVTSLARLG